MLFRSVSKNCLKFDGVNDYMSFSSLAMDGFRTFEFWIYPETISSLNRDWTVNAVFFDNGSNNAYDEFAIHLYNSNTLSAGWGGAGYQYDLTCSEMSLRKWHLVTVTVGEANTFLYINGVEKSSNTTVAGMNNFISTGSNTQFGHHPGAYPSFHGIIDDIKIYNAPISYSQVKRNYLSGLNSMYENGKITTEELLKEINSIAKTIVD